ncbi:hypothetical protein TNCV_2910201 [Trichonephila clavipes]|nr:hypothetical protein TNCV_2910201 [Trichonephila clavipes]
MYHLRFHPMVPNIISEKPPSRYVEKGGNVEMFLSFFQWLLSPSVILPFRVRIGPAENHDMAFHIMTDPLPFLAVGRRQLRPYTCAGVLQTFTRRVVGKNVKDG